MGVMDKFLNYMKLNGEDDDEYFDEDYLDDDEEVEAAPSNKITPIKQPSARRASGGAGMEVCVIKPTSVEDAREITETLLANRTVVLNLEGLDVDIAQRIIDFTGGSFEMPINNRQ